MKFKIKRILAVMLVFCMMMGVVPNALIAYAAAPNEPTGLTWDGNVAKWDTVDSDATSVRFFLYASEKPENEGSWNTILNETLDKNATSFDCGEYLNEGMSYRFSVWAENGDGHSQSEHSEVKTMPGSLGSIALTWGTGENEKVLSWSAVSGAKGYAILIKKDGVQLGSWVSQTQTELDLNYVVNSNGEGTYHIEVYANSMYIENQTNNWLAKGVTEKQLVPTTCKLVVNANNDAYGTVTGGGDHGKDTFVTVKATPNAGYRFVEWQKNGSQVDTHAEYTFKLSEDCTLTAVFEAMAGTAITDIALSGTPNLEVGKPAPTDVSTFTVAAGHNYTVTSVGWWDVTEGGWVSDYDNLIANHEYRAHIKIEPNSGYEFAASLNATMNGNPATVDILDGGKCVVYNFGKPVASTVVDVTGVSLNKTSTTLIVGNEETLTATVAPSNATNKNVTWKSSDETVATVTNGKVKALKAGTATITVTTEDGNKTATCVVTVNNPAGTITDIALSGTPNLEAGKPAPTDVSTFTVAAGHNYTVTSVDWWDVTEGGWVGIDNLIANHEYRAYIKIEPNSGYEFAASLNATMNGNPATVDILDGGKCVVYNFGKPKTDEGGETPVPTEYNITVTGGTASVGAGTPVDKATAGTVITLNVDELLIPEGMVFDEWKVVSGGVTIEGNKFTMLESDVVIEATYKEAEVETYTVYFFLDKNDEFATSWDDVEAGQTATAPADPAPEGKTFLGWYTSDDIKFDFATPINGDLNLYAKFEDANGGETPAPTTYDITVNNGTASIGAGASIEEAEAGTVITITAKAAAEGSVFDKWVVVSGEVEFADETSATTTFTMPAGDVVVEATYKNAPPAPEKYTVTFDSKGGSAVGSQIIEEGGKVTKPADPTKEGFDFVGWTFEDKEWNFDNAVTGDMTLVAVWKEKEVTPPADEDPVYGIVVNNGKSCTGAGVEITAAEEGTKITIKADEAPEGKEFDKWVVVSGTITLADATKAETTFDMPAERVEVTATYKDKEVTPPADDDGDQDDDKEEEPTKPTEPQKPSDNPQTGDNSNIFMWFALLFVSAVGIAVTTVLGKKRFFVK